MPKETSSVPWDQNRLRQTLEVRSTADQEIALLRRMVRDNEVTERRLRAGLPDVLARSRLYTTILQKVRLP